MKLDHGCLETVLEHIIDKTTINADTTRAGYNGINILRIVENIFSQGNYSKEEIMHCCLYAIRVGMVFTDNKIDMKNFTPSQIVILDINPLGYKYLKDGELY